jgi:hypothetical protein
MPPPNPLEPILDQLAEILSMTEKELKNPSTKQLSPELLKRVDKLESLIMSYVRVHQILLKTSGIDKQKLQQIIEHVPERTLSKDRNVLERLAKIKESVVQFKELFDKEANKVNLGVETDKERKKRATTKRKSKFRGVGDQDKWKKL